MAPCEDLPQMQTGVTMGDLIGYNIAIIQAYGQCSLRLSKLQQWIEQNP